jgi:hypothetical protein
MGRPITSFAGRTDAAGTLGALGFGSRSTTTFDRVGVVDAVGAIGLRDIDGETVSVTGFPISPVSHPTPTAPNPKTVITAAMMKAHRRRSDGSALGSSRMEPRDGDPHVDDAPGSREDRSAIAKT